MKHESETWVMTTETLNGLWHTNCHDPLDLLHHNEEQSLLDRHLAKLGNLDIDVIHYKIWI